MKKPIAIAAAGLFVFTVGIFALPLPWAGSVAQSNGVRALFAPGQLLRAYMGASNAAEPQFVSSASDDFRSRTNGNWTTPTSWESSPDGVNWTTATLAPNSQANSILIRSPHAIQINSAVSANTITVQSSSGLFIDTTGILTVDLINTTDLSVSGFLENRGQIVSNGRVTIQNGGLYVDTNGTGSGQSINYVGGALLKYQGSSTTSTDFEFPAVNGPKRVDVSLNTPAQTLTLHASRTLDQAAPNQALILGVGTITTNANTLTIGATSVVFDANIDSYVVGNLAKIYGGAGSFTFPVGTANGKSPVTANATAGTFPATFTVKATQGAYVAPATGLPPAPNRLARWWTLTNAGVTSANLTFGYLAADITGGTEANYKAFRISGSTATQVTSTTNAGAHTTTATGVTTFSDWTTAEGLPPEIDVTPASLPFGNVPVGQSSTPQQVTIQNTGAGDLLLGNITVGNAAYTIQNSPANTTVPGGGQVQFTVTFSPVNPGTVNTNLTINSNDADESSVNVPLSGTGTVTDIDITGNSIVIADGDTTPSVADDTDFGSTPVAGGSVVHTFTIVNTGNTTVAVSQPASNNPAFAITAVGYPQVIPIGQTRTFNVTFDPSSGGINTATISVGSTDPDESPYDFVVQGVGDVCTPPPVGMVSWYQGEGNGIDRVGNNPGTPQGGVTYSAGKVNQAFTLDGVSGFVEAPDSPSLSITGAISIDAWISANTTAPAQQALITKYDSPANQVSYGFFLNSGGQLEFVVYQAGDASVLHGVETATGVITTSTLYHVTGTFNPSNQETKIYLNGVDLPTTLIGVSQPVSSIFDGTAPLRIGAVVNSSAGIEPFAGLIDEVEIFNRALTAGEIAKIYNAGSAGKCTACMTPPVNMISWYRASGNADDFFGGHHGTLLNGATANGPGAVGTAFGLNGNQYVSIPDTPDLYPQAGSFTVDAWVRSTQTTGFQEIIAHYECGGALCGPSEYDMYLQDGKIAGGIRDSGNNLDVLTGTTLVADGNFHHVAMQRDIAGGQMRLYLDGALEASKVLTATGIVHDDDGEADPVAIGAIVGNAFVPALFFNGTIDEVEYFSRALTGGEIAGIYNAGGLGKCSVPTAAGATLSGRVMTAGGHGISNARVTVVGGPLTRQRTVLTGGFGYYTFEDLPAGQTYIVTVGGKRFRFAVPSRVISLAGDVTDADFVAEPQE